MSFSAKLIIDNIEYNVLSAKYEINQSEDGDGMPNEKAKGGKIEVTIESTKDTIFFEWAASSNATKNGELILLNRDNISAFKNIQFSDAYCLHFSEEFDALNDQPLYTKIIISAKGLDLKGATYDNNWPTRNS